VFITPVHTTCSPCQRWMVVLYARTICVDHYTAIFPLQVLQTIKWHKGSATKLRHGFQSNPGLLQLGEQWREACHSPALWEHEVEGQDLRPYFMQYEKMLGALTCNMRWVLDNIYAVLLAEGALRVGKQPSRM
jgi:hypothetical protein